MILTVSHRGEGPLQQLSGPEVHVSPVLRAAQVGESMGILVSGGPRDTSGAMGWELWLGDMACSNSK